MNTLRDKWNRFLTWHKSRKARRMRRAAGAVVDTTASGVGLALRVAVRAVATILLIVITTGLLFTCIFAVYVKTCLTEDLNVSLEEMTLSLSSVILYQDGDEWKELATLYSDEDRVWVDYADIPEDLEHAAVAIEDRHFYTHKGVDWFRTVGAFANMFVGMRNNFGGSTITQQLIKNLTEYDDVTVQRKLLEIFRALEFEKIYTKQEIVNWYLNEIYLGERCYGVGTASRVYFGKEVSQLDLAECASLIGITNNPSLYDPYISDAAMERNKKRQETILWEMYDQGYITYDEYVAAKNEELHFQRATDTVRTTTVNTYYVDTIIRDVIADLVAEKGISEATATHLLYNGGYRIYSCLDPRIQSIVDNKYQNPYNMPSPYRSSSQQLQSAIVIIDPYSGDIVAMSGGVGEKTASLTLNRATQSTRPPGSSFKPIAVYAPAIDIGMVTQNTKVNDSPDVKLSGTDWYPKNSGGYSGVISIRTALQYSKNTVAAQLLDWIGRSTSWDYLTNHFGITTLVRDEVQEDGRVLTDYAYSPLSLGQLSHGVTVREMAQAYTAFVNDGVMSFARTYSYIEDDNGEVILLNPTRQQVAVKSNTARNMADMLQNAVENGTGTEARFSSTAVAGKTGTTSDDKDRYFVGFTMYYVAAVWTGYDQPEKMYFSGNPAAQIFRSIMSDVHAGLPYRSFPTPTSGGSGSKTDTVAASPSPSPSESPEVSESPVPTDTPEPTPTPTAPPVGYTSTPVPTEVPATPTPTVVPTEVPSEPTPVQPTEAPPVTAAPTEPPPADVGGEEGG